LTWDADLYSRSSNIILLFERKYLNLKYLSLRVCLDLEKLEGKKNNLEGNFLSTVLFEKSQKKKNRQKNARKTLKLLLNFFFLPNMRGK